MNCKKPYSFGLATAMTPGLATSKKHDKHTKHHAPLSHPVAVKLAVRIIIALYICLFNLQSFLNQKVPGGAKTDLQKTDRMRVSHRLFSQTSQLPLSSCIEQGTGSAWQENAFHK